MRFEDFGKLFEDALDYIEPKDEAHREKLEKARENIRKINEEAARDLAKLQEDLERMNAGSNLDDGRDIILERERLSTELREAMTSSFHEHASLIDKIAEARRAI